MLEQLFTNEATAVGAALIDAAKRGDVGAQTFIIRRLVPVRHGYPIEFNLPQIDKPDDLVAAMAMIAKQMSDGKLTPGSNARPKRPRSTLCKRNQRRLADPTSAIVQPFLRLYQREPVYPLITSRYSRLQLPSSDHPTPDNDACRTHLGARFPGLVGSADWLAQSACQDGPFVGKLGTAAREDPPTPRSVPVF
jgi:hypothetical protein